MLIKRSPDAYEKLSLLGSMAGDDVLSNPLDARPSTRMPYSSAKKNSIPGVYRAAMPNGKFINLMRVMFTDLCLSIWECSILQHDFSSPSQEAILPSMNFSIPIPKPHPLRPTAGV